jgi:hypothetical protein
LKSIFCATPTLTWLQKIGGDGDERCNQWRRWWFRRRWWWFRRRISSEESSDSCVWTSVNCVEKPLPVRVKIPLIAGMTVIITRGRGIWWLIFTYAPCISIMFKHNNFCHLSHSCILCLTMMSTSSQLWVKKATRQCL